jgi:hypothetical protein
VIKSPNPSAKVLYNGKLQTVKTSKL